LLPWKQLRPRDNGVRFYLKSDVKRVFLEGFKSTDVRFSTNST